MRKILLPVLLIPVVLLAGCVRQETTKTMNGIAVKTFSPEPAEIEPGMTSGVVLTIGNVGGEKATDVSAELMGLTGECKICKGAECASDGVEKQMGVRNQKIGELWPADPERGMTHGQEGRVTWAVTPPKKDVSVSYDMTARVYYTYSTASESILRIVTMPYYQTFGEEKKVGRDWGIVSSDTTPGPLTVTVNSPKPIVSEGASEPVDIWFEFQNVGGGSVFRDGEKPTADNLDIITVKDTGIANCKETEVKLAKGESGRLDCTVSPGIIENYKDMTISLKVEYRYFVDANSQIEQPLIEKAKYGDDVITVEDYFARPLQSRPGDEIKIDFYVQNNGDETIENVEVNFFDGLEVFKPYTLNCAGKTGTNGVCRFESIGSLDNRRVSLTLTAPTAESKMDFTLSYYISYTHSGYREAHIPAIAPTEEEPSLKFFQSTPTWGPVVLEFEPPVGRERKEDEKVIKEYWVTQTEPFWLKMVFKHVGSGSVGEVAPITIQKEKIGPLELVDLTKIDCNLKDVTISGKTKESDILCRLQADEKQAEIKGVVKASFDYDYKYIRKQTFTINPVL